MKIILPVFFLMSAFAMAQSNSIFDERYYDHWESIDTNISKLEIIIYMNNNTTRVVELDFDTQCEILSANILYPTVYVHKKHNGIMAVETINMRNLELIDSEYILSENNTLLRITKNDTIAFRRRFIGK